MPSRLVWTPQPVQAAIKKRLQSAADDMGRAMVNDVKSHMTGGGAGGSGLLVGRRKGGTSEKTPSRPGQPPQVQTGRLRDSIGYTYSPDGPNRGAIKGQAHQEDAIYKPKTVDDSVVLTVGTNVPYSYFLEHGTRKLQMRPFLRPMLERFKRVLVDYITNAK